MLIGRTPESRARATDRIAASLADFAQHEPIDAASIGAILGRIRNRVSRPERVIAAHFWYPPQLIPLVEVCAGPLTDPAVTAWTCEVLKAHLDVAPEPAAEVAWLVPDE